MNPCARTNVLKPPDEFLFPFPPYDIQKDFMKNLYSVLEESKFGIFESPTGTVSIIFPPLVGTVLYFYRSHVLHHRFVFVSVDCSPDL